METSVLIIGFIILAATAGFYFIDLPEENLIVDFETNKEKLSMGEELTVKVRGTNATLKQITIDFADNKQIKNCENLRDCFFEITVTPKEGVYILKIRVESTTNKIEKTKRITVIKEKQECVNEISFGQCAQEKPLYCNNGLLENNCETCGCETNQYCSNSNCFITAGNINLLVFDYPTEVLIGREFEIIGEIEAVEQIFQGAQYRVELILGEKEIIKNYSLEAKPGEKIELKIGLTLEQGSYDLNFSVFALNKEKQLVGNIFVKNAITAKTILTRLDIPQITSIFVEGDDVIISWNKISGAKEYKLYKSVDANPAFISYKYYKSFSAEQNTGVIQALAPGTHFFVLTAANDFGGESEYSEVQTAGIE